MSFKLLIFFFKIAHNILTLVQVCSCTIVLFCVFYLVHDYLVALIKSQPPRFQSLMQRPPLFGFAPFSQQRSRLHVESRNTSLRSVQGWTYRKRRYKHFIRRSSPTPQRNPLCGANRIIWFACNLFLCMVDMRRRREGEMWGAHSFSSKTMWMHTPCTRPLLDICECDWLVIRGCRPTVS